MQRTAPARSGRPRIFRLSVPHSTIATVSGRSWPFGAVAGDQPLGLAARHRAARMRSGSGTGRSRAGCVRSAGSRGCAAGRRPALAARSRASSACRSAGSSWSCGEQGVEARPGVRGSVDCRPHRACCGRAQRRPAARRPRAARAGSARISSSRTAAVSCDDLGLCRVVPRRFGGGEVHLGGLRLDQALERRALLRVRIRFEPAPAVDRGLQIRRGRGSSPAWAIGGVR